MYVFVTSAQPFSESFLAARFWARPATMFVISSQFLSTCVRRLLPLDCRALPPFAPLYIHISMRTFSFIVYSWSEFISTLNSIVGKSCCSSSILWHVLLLTKCSAYVSCFTVDALSYANQSTSNFAPIHAEPVYIHLRVEVTMHCHCFSGMVIELVNLRLCPVQNGCTITDYRKSLSFNGKYKIY